MIGYDLSKHQKNLVYSLVGSISTEYIEIEKLFRHEIAMCLKCMEFGYHSIFHQFKFLNYCPFHNEPLLESKYKNYIITDNSLINYFYKRSDLKVDQNVFFMSKKKLWRVTASNFQLKCGMTRVLIDNHQNFNNQLQKKLYFDPDLLINHKYNLDKYFQILQWKFPLKYTHSTINSFISPKINRGDKIFTNTEEDLNLLYLSTKQTFRSINRHFKSTILLKHRKCFKSRINNHPNTPLCSYTNAYVHWRKFIEGFNNINEVDQRRSRNNNSTFYFKVYTYKEYLSIEKVYYKVIASIDEKHRTCKIVFWLINRIYANMIINDFYNWLNLFKEKEESDETYYTRPFNKESLPQFVIEINIDLNNIINLHFM